MDTGWKKSTPNVDQYGNKIKIKNMARHLARQGMKAAIADLKKGPEAPEKKKQNEETEQVDEISSDMLRKAKHKAYAMSSAADEAGKTKEADKRFSQAVKFQNREYDVSKKEGQRFSKYMASKD